MMEQDPFPGQKKISFGGIPNTVSIILMPRLTTWAPFFFAVVLLMWTMLSPKGVQNNHMAAPDKVARQQTTPELSGTLQNLPELASPTYTSTHRNSPPEPSTPELSGTFRNLPTPAHSVTLRNLPEPASGTYTTTHRNSLEPSGTCRRNLDQHTHWNSPEPSGTCSCHPHRHTLEPIWAEDPISLRCWGKKITSLRVIPTATSYWHIFVTNPNILCAKIWRGREGEDNSDEI